MTKHTEESLMALVGEIGRFRSIYGLNDWHTEGVTSTLRLAIREVLAERDDLAARFQQVIAPVEVGGGREQYWKQRAELAEQDGKAAFDLSVECRARAVRAEAEVERLRKLMKRARYFVKNENDACIIACPEDPNYCCADTLTAIDAALAQESKP